MSRADDEPDWKQIFGRSTGHISSIKTVRPRRKKMKSEPLDCYTTPEERRAEIRDKKHELFVAEMESRKRWDILDDPEIAAHAFDDWLKTEDPTESRT